MPIRDAKTMREHTSARKNWNFYWLLSPPLPNYVLYHRITSIIIFCFVHNNIELGCTSYIVIHLYLMYERLLETMFSLSAAVIFFHLSNNNWDCQASVSYICKKKIIIQSIQKTTLHSAYAVWRKEASVNFNRLYRFDRLLAVIALIKMFNVMISSEFGENEKRAAAKMEKNLLQIS